VRRNRVRRRVVGCVGCCAALWPVATGCAALAPDESPALHAADSFERAVSDGDGEAACGLLAAGAVEELERSEGRPCRKALTSLTLPQPGHERSVDVYGLNARVVTDTDVVFLSNSGGDWKVTAAGCHGASGDQPYTCIVTAG
jgi:hypothetical protein